MDPKEMLAKLEAKVAIDEKRSKELANELNEKLGMVPRKYVPMFRVPEEPWRAGAIWDKGYFDVAKHVVTAIVKRDLVEGVHGVAGLYLFRHYVELQLKYILLYSRWLKDKQTLADEANAIRKTHSVQAIWDDIKKEVPDKLGKDVWKKFDTPFIDELIRELHSVDSNGESFRYVGSEFGDSETAFMNELQVRYSVLLAQMDHVFHVLHSIAFYLYETHGQIMDYQSDMASW